MNTDKTTTTATRNDKPDFVKRIGKTTYKVNVHFSTTSRETINDKIMRLLRNEVQQSPKM
jgi:3-hydroxy-3-methylglutaryl CoA synthase